MRISLFCQLAMVAFCGAVFTACGTPPNTNATSSTSSSTGEASVSSSSGGGSGGMASSSTGGVGGTGGMAGTGGMGGSGGFGGGTPDLNASGTVNIPNLAADTKLVVIWSVSAGSPDYLYKWGDGQTDGKTFTVSLMGAPPPEAINGGFVGVGIIAVVASSYVVPEGKLTSTQATDLETNLLGFSAQHAIIYHPKASTSPYPWSSQFSDGYQCGKCVPMGASFDHWAPTNCSDVILVDPSQSVCNWT